MKQGQTVLIRLVLLLATGLFFTGCNEDQGVESQAGGAAEVPDLPPDLNADARADDVRRIDDIPHDEWDSFIVSHHGEFEHTEIRDTLHRGLLVLHGLGGCELQWLRTRLLRFELYSVYMRKRQLR